MSRTVCWFSCGAASAVATKLTLGDSKDVVVAYCETNSEHEDNARFKKECEEWFGVEIIILSSRRFEDTWAVWEKRKFLSGPKGAPCTRELKVLPRLKFQRPDDVHIFGYTADKLDVARSKRLVESFPEMSARFPLIDRGITKEACLAMLSGVGIEPPITYALGFPNANCIPCVKATSPAYWALVRRHAPEKFERMAKLSRQLGARLARINNVRVFIDEIPENYPTTDPIVPSCDFLCSLAEKNL